MGKARGYRRFDFGLCDKVSLMSSSLFFLVTCLSNPVTFSILESNIGQEKITLQFSQLALLVS
jgi:hypothetical protein